MNFEFEIDRIKKQQEAERYRMKNLESKFKTAKKFTQTFLNLCGKRGIDKVSIGRKHDSIKATIGWPFGHEGSVFGIGSRTNEGMPPIWGVCEELKISGGCGNPDQHSAKTENLIDGVYHLKKGKWLKVD